MIPSAPPDPRLINASRSARGWSRIGTFIKCPMLFAVGNRLDVDLWGGATDKGSLGHVAQAHQHAIWGMEQAQVDGKPTLAGDRELTADDIDSLYDAEEAMQAYCEANPRGWDHIPLMVEVFRRYIAAYPEPPGRIVAVEAQMKAVCGVRAADDGDRWGLWVVPPDTPLYDPISVVNSIPDPETGEIYPIHVTPLNVPGHARHGTPVWVTRRLDLSIARGQTVEIWDHKHQANVAVGKSTTAYAMDGGFALFRLMGQQMYGRRFGGLRVNLIQTQEPWAVRRAYLKPTPHRDSHLANLIWSAEHRLANVEMSTPNYWEWPKTMNETVCYGRYGACKAYNLCAYGPSALQDY